MSRNKITRRQFVSTVTIGTGAVLAGTSALAGSAPSGISSIDASTSVVLGKSGIKTSLLGMGTGFSGNSSSADITRAVADETLIRKAYEKGIRFFDCADSYGTHRHLASSLEVFTRESYVLGTKMWVSQNGVNEYHYPDADVVVDRFRKELNTDYIDLIQIHCMTDSRWSEKEKKQMDILENLKSRKIIRAHGVSVHSVEALEACVGNPWVDVVHVRINPFGESMDKPDPALITPIIEKLHNEGKGVIGMKLFGAGKYKNDPEKVDEALKFIVGLGTVDLLLFSFEKPEQIDDYLIKIKNTGRIL
jgi:aryl-alcohol dehydrogenase-like predicted oxidoreductase